MNRAFALTLALGLAWLLPVQADDAKKDAEAIKGTWKVTKATRDGQPPPQEGNLELTFTADEVTPKMNGQGDQPAKYKLDAGKSPKQIDIMPPNGGTWEGIYEIKEDTLKICFRRGNNRPTSFDATGDGVMYIEAKREKK